MFEQAWKRKPYDRDELAETVVAIEVQNATRQASDPLRSKVDAWSAAIENLKVASVVLWIVEPAAFRIPQADTVDTAMEDQGGQLSFLRLQGLLP